MTPSEIIRLFLFVYHFYVDYFLSPVIDIVHLCYPQHLILRFELFGDVFCFCKFLHQLLVHFCCFFIDVGEVVVELAGCQQIIVENFVMLFVSLVSCFGKVKLGRL